MTMTPTAERVVALDGGPMDGEGGEVVGRPLVIRFGENGGFVYRRDEQEDGLHYVYAPDLSPAHDALVEADRQAIMEVAERDGLTPAQVLERARQRKDSRTGLPAAAVLLAEADRLGVDPLHLLASGYDPVTGLHLPEGARS